MDDLTDKLEVINTACNLINTACNLIVSSVTDIWKEIEEIKYTDMKNMTDIYAMHRETRELLENVIGREKAVDLIMKSVKEDPFVVDENTSQDFVDGAYEQACNDAALIDQM